MRPYTTYRCTMNSMGNGIHLKIHTTVRWARARPSERETNKLTNKPNICQMYTHCLIDCVDYLLVCKCLLVHIHTYTCTLTHAHADTIPMHMWLRKQLAIHSLCAPLNTQATHVNDVSATQSNRPKWTKKKKKNDDIDLSKGRKNRISIKWQGTYTHASTHTERKQQQTTTLYQHMQVSAWQLPILLASPHVRVHVFVLSYSWLCSMLYLHHIVCMTLSKRTFDDR